MSVGRTQGPLANHLRGAGEYGVTRALVERLLCRGHFAPDPLVIGIELQIAEAIVEAIATANLRGPFIVNACHHQRTISQEDRRKARPRFSTVVAAAVD